jgi:polyhydroxyalkanoate synthesis regulator phasin
MVKKCSDVNINSLVEERVNELIANEAFMQKIVNQRIQDMMKKGALSAEEEFAFLQQLERQGIQPQQFNNLFKMLENKILYNEKLINSNEAQILKQQWQDYINLKKEIPDIIDNKEEIYYLFTEKVGLNPPGTYHNVLKTRYTLNDYTGLTNSSNKIKELLNVRRKQKKKLEEKIDQFIRTVDTNERKIFYEIKEEDWLNFYKYVIFFIYYLLAIYYLFFGSFFWNDKYKNYKNWIILILYISLPFFLMNLINLFFRFYDYVKSLINRQFPRNVYIDL